MKKNLKSLIAASAGSFMKKAVLSVGVSIMAFSSADAQCMTSNLDVTTGVVGGATPMSLTPGVNDPNWIITGKTAGFGTFSTPTPALVVNPYSGWGTMGNAWICDNQQHASPGVTLPANSTMTFGRKFCIYEDAEVTFDLSILVDNYVTSITVDGVVVPGSPAQSAGTWSSTPWAVPTFTIPLTAGSHKLEIVVHEDNVPWANPTGLSVKGNITTATAILVDDMNPECYDFKCEPPTTSCSDKCYWKVEGNNILNGNNIFGTLTDNDIHIKSNNMSRGVIKGGSTSLGGFFGWNTMSPTARFHVNCNNGNDGMPSDIRFEGLEAGEGSILAIDDNGYVYNTHVPVGQESPVAPEVMNMKEEIRDLKMQLAELRQTLATGSVDKYNAQVQNELYQNNPNPFGKETSIGYNIVNMQQGAFIAVYDLNGKELFRQAVIEKGKGSVTLSGEKLVPGMYLYSLIVDGKETATKRMVVTK